MIESNRIIGQVVEHVTHRIEDLNTSMKIGETSMTAPLDPNIETRDFWMSHDEANALTRTSLVNVGLSLVTFFADYATVTPPAPNAIGFIHDLIAISSLLLFFAQGAEVVTAYSIAWAQARLKENGIQPTQRTRKPSL